MYACPNGFRGPPPSGLTWQVPQPSTEALRNGSARNACRNCGIENDGMFHRRRQMAIAHIRFIIENPTSKVRPESSKLLQDFTGESDRTSELHPGDIVVTICHTLQTMLVHMLLYP